MSSTHLSLPSRRELFPLAILSSLLTLAPLAAHAAAISDASYDVTAATIGPPPIAPGSGTFGTGTFSDGVSPTDVLYFGSPGGVSVGIHTFGDDAGSYFGSRSSGEINGTDRAYRVDGDFALDFTGIVATSLSFNIIPGQVLAQGAPTGGAGLQSGDFLKAELTLSISRRDAGTLDPFVEIFGTHAVALVDDTGSFVSWTGNDIGYACASGPTFVAGGSLAECLFSGGPFSVSLGTGSHDIQYTLSTVASGSVSTSAGTCGAFVDQGEPRGFAVGIKDPGSDAGGPCRSVAQVGDPLAFVPEPATIGLLALGLVAAGRARRKQPRAAAGRGSRNF